jgi:mannose-1-phosphate guanylyltransferase
MFVWKASRILEEIERHMPRLHQALRSLESTLGLPSQATALEAQWAAIEPETIDYGVMEKVGTAVVLPSEGLGWLDLGNWDRVLEAGPVDRLGNRTIGDRILAEETRRSLILQGDAAERWVITLGVEDLIVVDTGDVLLICARDRAEEVRRLVDRMGEVAGLEYL